MDSASFSICTQFLSDCRSAREANSTGVPWNWSNERERAFQNVKKRLTEAPILAYFDTNKEVVLQVGSSKNGVGAVLLQDGKPVEVREIG
jgi:hypothetical protein